VTGSRINRQRFHGGFIRVRYQRREALRQGITTN
jgi:hypothetical protein